MLTLGLFVFTLQSAPIATIRRSTAQRWESKPRAAGGAPAWQWIGPGDDSVTIDGLLMPELTGGPENLDALRDMAAAGTAWMLIAGTGESLGRWFIKSVEETRSHFAGPGLPRRIAFTLALERYWDDDPSQFGELGQSA
ncbi:MAG: phage tail protein [Alphaproteobacteria bacterium]|nr:phage tail protein [Alphaproteobacteria bacterium]MBF0394907.1 phage tail protein [Alphaproteobacteria bacterium]